MAVLALTYDNTAGRFFFSLIGADQLQNQLITSAKVAALAIGAPHLAWGGITSGKAGSQSICPSNLFLDAQSFMNLLYNGDFEVGDPPAGWSVVSAVTPARETTIVKIGAASMKLTSTGLWARINQAISDYSRYKGRDVVFGAWCYAPSTNSGSQKISIYWKVTGGEVHSAAVPKDDAWHWVTVPATISTDATNLEVDFFANFGDGAADVLYVDGAIFVEGAAIPAFAPRPVDYASVLSGMLGSGQLGTPHIRPGSILSALVAAGAIGGGLIADQNILSGKYAAQSIRTADIGNAQILSALIGGNVLATPHIQNQGILSASLGPSAIGTPHIALGAILSSLIGASQVGTPHITPGAVLSSLIGAGAIGAPHLAWGGITSGKAGSQSICPSNLFLDAQSFMNLLYNGDFEVGDPPAGWSVVSQVTPARETTIVKIGAASMKLTSTDLWARINQAISDYSRYKGRDVVFGAWCYAPSTNSGSQKISIYWKATGGEVHSAAVPKDDAWHWVTVPATISTDATNLEVDFFANFGDGAADVLYVDGAIFVEGAAIPAFAPRPVDYASVLSGMLGSGQLGTPHIKPGSILSATIGAGVIGTPHIALGGILSAAIGALQVGTAHLADLAIRSGKIVQSDLWLSLLGERAHPSLTSIGLDDHHIQFTSGMHSFPHPSALIADAAILSGKIGSGQVGADHLAPGAVPRIASGTYAGNSTANRAIAHGLGVTPKLVIIVGLGVPTSYWYRLFSGQGAIFYQTGASASSTPVTAPDATNFYVGNSSPGYDQSANLTGNSYAWVAIG